jgi:hypothetical protein
LKGCVTIIFPSNTFHLFLYKKKGLHEVTQNKRP